MSIVERGVQRCVRLWPPSDGCMISRPTWGLLSVVPHHRWILKRMVWDSVKVPGICARRNRALLIPRTLGNVAVTSSLSRGVQRRIPHVLRTLVLGCTTLLVTLSSLKLVEIPLPLRCLLLCNPRRLLFYAPSFRFSCLGVLLLLPLSSCGVFLSPPCNLCCCTLSSVVDGALVESHPVHVHRQVSY